MNWKQHIESNPDNMVGKPVIRGTRLTVEFIVGRLADGWSQADLLENYPALSEERILAVYAYLHAMLRDSMVFDLGQKSAA